MSSRLQRKVRRAKKIAGWKEHFAARSKYAAKKFEQEHGRPPRQTADGEARKKP